MTNEALEPIVRELLSAKYERKLPPNLFAETPPEREKLKKRYREIFIDTMDEFKDDAEGDLNKMAGFIASSINEMISEEALAPCPEDWN